MREGAARARAGPEPVAKKALRPELALERLDGLFRGGGRVDAGGEVLPAAVGDDERDVGALSRLDRFPADADGRVQGRAGGDAREDALLLEEFTGAGDRVGGADREAAGEDGGVVELGDEALVEVAQTVDEVVVARFGGDDPDVRLVLAQVAADAHEG